MWHRSNCPILLIYIICPINFHTEFFIQFCTFAYRRRLSSKQHKKLSQLKLCKYSIQMVRSVLLSIYHFRYSMHVRLYNIVTTYTGIYDSSSAWTLEAFTIISSDTITLHIIYMLFQYSVEIIVSTSIIYEALNNSEKAERL